MRCKRCWKAPKDIQEYVDYGAMAGLTPAEYVRQEEGTYNRDTELFYCTECYIAVGMPLGTA